MNINSALSGLRASQMQLNVTGNNIANASTPNFQEKTALLQDNSNGGVSVSAITPVVDNSTLVENNVNLASQMVNLKIQELAYNMNAKTIKAQNEMIGTLINTMA